MPRNRLRPPGAPGSVLCQHNAELASFLLRWWVGIGHPGWERVRVEPGRGSAAEIFCTEGLLRLYILLEWLLIHLQENPNSDYGQGLCAAVLMLSCGLDWAGISGTPLFL